MAMRTLMRWRNLVMIILRNILLGIHRDGLYELQDVGLTVSSQSTIQSLMLFMFKP